MLDCGPQRWVLITEDADMALGRRKPEQQSEFWVPTADLPQSPGHPFYEQLNQVLAAAGFDRFCEQGCRKFYAAKLGRPSVPPGVYFRQLLLPKANRPPKRALTKR